MALDPGPELQPGVLYRAIIHTTLGPLRLRLFADKAPVTVRNFVNLAEGTRESTDPRNGQTGRKPYYNGVIFHRCIPEFMVQGGDPTGRGTGGPGYTFQDEFNPALRFDRPGLLAMANAGPATNGSQFFITEVPTPHLNNRHTIFGELEDAAGLDIVRKMSRAPQDARNRPNQDIRIERIEILRVKP